MYILLAIYVHLTVY